MGCDIAPTRVLGNSEAGYGFVHLVSLSLTIRRHF